MIQSSWIRTPKANPMARIRLFCFPYAGGGASIYRTWGNVLPNEIELCAIQLPGRENRIREKAITNLDELIQMLILEVRPYLDKPFAIFGHSMGTLLGYAFAQQLHEQYNLNPTHLLVSGRHAPHRPAKDSPIHRLPGDEFLDTVQRRYGGIPAIILQDQEMRDLFIPLLQADFSVLETYHHKQDVAPLTCPILAYGALSDPLATRADLQFWGELTDGPLSIHMFSGSHFYLNEKPQPLIEMIGRTLLT